MENKYALTDIQWDKIKNSVPGKVGDVGVTAKNNRLFVDAIDLLHNLNRYVIVSI